jgi:hypothetical protein
MGSATLSHRSFSGGRLPNRQENRVKTRRRGDTAAFVPMAPKIQGNSRIVKSHEGQELSRTVLGRGSLFLVVPLFFRPAALPEGKL